VIDSGIGEAKPVSESRILEKQFERILGEHGAAISRVVSSYETVAGVREELVEEIALATIWYKSPPRPQIWRLLKSLLRHDTQFFLG
jgi:hypothetical protein